MNTVMTCQIVSTSSAATFRLGERVGRALKGGEIIELVSDLGGGKTVFTGGLAQGLGSKDAVASPSFTISRLYRAKNLNIMHFDFYRLKEPGSLKHELAEAVNDPQTVVVVEWGDIVAGVLPAKRLTVAIKPLSDNKRQLTFAYPKTLAYLTKDVC